MTLRYPPYQHSPGLGSLPSFAPFGGGTDARNRRGLGTVRAAPTPHVAGPPKPPSSPYGGLFTGSAFDQAQKIAAYLTDPYTQQYNTLTAQHTALDKQRLADLQAYIQHVAEGLQGVAPQVLAAYQGAAQDQTAFAQGFSDAVKGAVQDSASQDNALLSQIGAPSGQDIPASQAVGVGDVLYGTGGYIPATSLAAQGARAFADAAGLPALIQQRGLGVIADLLGKQQDAQATLDAAYQQQLAQQPQNVLGIYSDIKQRQAANQTAAQKARSDALSGAQRQAETLTTATGYLYVVGRNGQVKRATDRGGKPVLTLAGQKAAQGPGGNPYFVVGSSSAGWTIYDKQTGKVVGTKPPATAKPNLYPVVDKTTGDITWFDKTTGQPVSQSLGAAGTPPEKPPTPPATVSGPDGIYAWQQTKGGWQLIPVGPRKTTAAKPPGTVTGPDGLYTWQQTKGGWQLIPVGPRKPQKPLPTPKPPDTFSSNGQTYVWQQNKYGNWTAVPIGAKPTKPRFTPLEIAHFKATAADSAYDAFWGVKDKNGNFISAPKHYQEAMSDLLHHGIPLDVAQNALNQFWTRPGYDADIASRQNGKRVWFHSGAGRPLRPFQARQAPKDTAAAETAARTTQAADVSRFVYVARDANRDGVGINPGVVEFVGALGAKVKQRLQISTGTNHNQFVAGEPGHQSQHWTGDAADIPAIGKRLTYLGQQALILAGADPKWAKKQTGGAFTINGVNILFNTTIGGNHYNHLHVGLTGEAEATFLGTAAAEVQNSVPALATSGSPLAAANTIRNFLGEKGSPLAGEAQFIVQQGRKYGVDPRLIVAIAGAETSFGTYGPSQRIHNPFGWGPNVTFPSWRAAISKIARALRFNYIDQGYDTVAKISAKWAPVGAANDPSGLNRNWIDNVTAYLTALGGDPNSLLMGA